MADSLTREVVETSRRVLDAELMVPTGMDPQPHLQRWKEIRPHLEELGWFDLLGTPETGGLGLPPAVAVRLLRLAGQHLVPGPVVDSVLTVPWLLSQPGVPVGVLEGFRLSVATVDPCADLGRTIEVRDGRIRGTARCVLGAGDAEALLVHVLDHDTERLVVLPTAHPDVHVEPLRGADPCQPVGHVELDCAVGEMQLVCSTEEDLPVRLRAWRRVGSAAYLAGIAERVLSFGVEHALQREQFGRRIGTFQAVQHLLADVAVIAQSLANLVDFSAQELPVVGGREAVLVGAAAKARAGSEAVLACETVLQVLGGIGFTVEHPLHHYLKRAISLAAQHGSPAELNLLAGRMVLAQRQESPGVVRVP